jgi:ribosomal protein L24E
MSSKYGYGYTLRPCAICSKPVKAVPHQSDEARACSPKCASSLAHREHPDIVAWGANKLQLVS